MQCSSSCQKNKQLFQEEGGGQTDPSAPQSQALFPWPQEMGWLSGLLTQVYMPRQNRGSGLVL